MKLVAEIFGRKDKTAWVVAASGNATSFKTLQEAENYTFSLGADTCTSQGIGYTRATKAKTSMRVF